MSADAQSKHFPVTKGLRHAIRQVKDCLGDSGTPAGAQGPAAAAAVAGAGDQDATGDEPTFGKASGGARAAHWLPLRWTRDFF